MREGGLHWEDRLSAMFLPSLRDPGPPYLLLPPPAPTCSQLLLGTGTRPQGLSWGRAAALPAGAVAREKGAAQSRIPRRYLTAHALPAPLGRTAQRAPRAPAGRDEGESVTPGSPSTVVPSARSTGSTRRAGVGRGNTWCPGPRDAGRTWLSHLARPRQAPLPPLTRVRPAPSPASAARLQSPIISPPTPPILVSLCPPLSLSSPGPKRAGCSPHTKATGEMKRWNPRNS